MCTYKCVFARICVCVYVSVCVCVCVCVYVLCVKYTQVCTCMHSKQVLAITSEWGENLLQ